MKAFKVIASGRLGVLFDYGAGPFFNRPTAEDAALELLKKPEVQQVQIVPCELSEDEKHDETEEQQ